MPSAASLANLKPPWQPGEGGNGKLNNRGYNTVLKAARTLSTEAVQVLAECIRDPNAPWPSRITAATTILDRAWGKPREHVQIDGDGIASLRIVFVDPNETIPTPTPTINGVASQTRSPHDASETRSQRDASEAQPDTDAFQVAFAEPGDEAT